MPQAAVTDWHGAVRAAMVPEPAENLQSGAGRGSWTETARVTIGARDGAVLERDEAAMGAHAPEDRGSKGGEGRGAVGMGLPMDVPGEGPDGGGEGFEQAHWVHGFFAQSAGDQGAGWARDQAVRWGGQPR